MDMDVVINAVLVIGVIGLVGMFFLQYLNVCEPHEVLVFAGGAHQDTSGRKSGFRPEFAGWHLRYPIIEKVASMDLRIMPIEITVENALSEGGIPLTIHSIANVKISSDPKRVRNAIERFLGVPQEEIERVCKENLEGILREVVGKMTPEEVNHDRMKFAGIVYKEVAEDLEKLGLEVDTLKIQSVHDDVDYLKSIGRAAIAQAHREAEVAESDAARAAQEQEADSEGAIRVAQERAELAIKERTNELQVIRNELGGGVAVEQERTAAAARQARAQAERRLQEVRTELEQLRLQADVVLPAQADQAARALLAEGEAAMIREHGLATAAVVDMIHTALADCRGSEGMDIFVLQKIDSILEQVVASVERVNVGAVTLVDSGDGSTLPAFVGSYPRMLGSVLEELRELLGLDVRGALRSASQALTVRSAGETGPPPADEVDDLTPARAFSMTVARIARARPVGDAERRIFSSMARLLGIEDRQRDALVAAALAAPPGDDTHPDEASITPRSLYAGAYRLAVRDGKLKAKEAAVLARIAKAMGIDAETEREIREGIPVPDLSIEDQSPDSDEEDRS